MIEVLPADGLVIVAKHECHTCVLVEPVLRQLGAAALLHFHAILFEPSTSLEGAHSGGGSAIETSPTFIVAFKKAPLMSPTNNVDQ